MFEKQYNDLFQAIDLIAEIIRALREKAPGKFAAYIKVTNIKEGNENLDANKVVEDLARDQDVIISTLNKTLKESQKNW